MKLEVIPVAQDAEDRSFKNAVAVVIDVLRATTSIQAILENGGGRVFPVAGLEEARELKKSRPTALLCGERGGYPPPGFDMGNSPVGFAEADLAGRDIILTTTNGTLAVSHAKKAEHLYSGCIRNVVATADVVGEHKDVRNVVILCAGTEGRFSIEDFYAAGLLVSHLARRENAELTDIAWAAVKLAEQPLPTVVNETTCSHYAALIAKGFGEDVSYALGIGNSSKIADGCAIVPVFDRGLSCFCA